MIELRPLRQFVAVAEELHFGRAAVRLHMTQPPLTQAIQQLERTLGAPLFVRTQRSVALAPAGVALLPQVRRLLAAAEALPQQAKAAAAGQAGALRLAFVSSIAYGPMPDWLRSFREEHPDIALTLREATLDVQLQAFASDEIDAGFVLHAQGAAPAGLAAWCVLEEPLMLAVPEPHALAAGRRPLSFARMAGEPLVIFPRTIAPSLYDAVLGAYRERGATPVIAQEAIQMQTIVNLVSSGIGVAWVPAALQQLRRPGVVYRAVAGAPSCETSLVWREPVSPVVQRFLSHVQRQSVHRDKPARARTS